MYSASFIVYCCGFDDVLSMKNNNSSFQIAQFHYQQMKQLFVMWKSFSIRCIVLTYMMKVGIS